MEQGMGSGKNRHECGLDAGHLGLILAGAGIGAGLMYIFDPRSGRRRRALLSDQITSAAHDLSDAAQAKARDLRNRAQGAVAEVGSLLKSETGSASAGS